MSDRLKKRVAFHAYKNAFHVYKNAFHVYKERHLDAACFNKQRSEFMQTPFRKYITSKILLTAIMKLLNGKDGETR